MWSSVSMQPCSWTSPTLVTFFTPPPRQLIMITLVFFTFHNWQSSKLSTKNWPHTTQINHIFHHQNGIPPWYAGTTPQSQVLGMFTISHDSWLCLPVYLQLLHSEIEMKICGNNPERKVQTPSKVVRNALYIPAKASGVELWLDGLAVFLWWLLRSPWITHFKCYEKGPPTSYIIFEVLKIYIYIITTFIPTSVSHT